ncbi:MAG: NrpR regulatory domain-containing protein, partial [Planctomycetota bacterium]
MDRRAERARTAILKVLSEVDEPLGAGRLAERLPEYGVDLQARAIRLYLEEMDRSGLTRLISRRAGRVITTEGRRAILEGSAVERMGHISARLDELSAQADYNIDNGAGRVVVNHCLIPRRELHRAIREMKLVYESPFSAAARIALTPPNRTTGPLSPPKDTLGISIPCSLTVNAILLRQGIPVRSRFVGILELAEMNPTRFVEAISYQGASLDPLELFLRAGLTTVQQAAKTGRGRIAASFREIPTVAMPRAREVLRRLTREGLGGVMAVGRPGQPLLGVPTTEG